MGGAPPRMPGGDSQKVQKMLDENSSLIKTISEFQNMGRHQESMNYQVWGTVPGWLQRYSNH